MNEAKRRLAEMLVPEMPHFCGTPVGKLTKAELIKLIVNLLKDKPYGTPVMQSAVDAKSDERLHQLQEDRDARLPAKFRNRRLRQIVARCLRKRAQRQSPVAVLATMLMTYCLFYLFLA